eukprot:scaffold311788_cov17-Prasinocladus_malaysianus.AAC.1
MLPGGSSVAEASTGNARTNTADATQYIETMKRLLEVRNISYEYCSRIATPTHNTLDEIG